MDNVFQRLLLTVTANVRFQRLEKGAGYVLVISAHVAYQGPDLEMRRRANPQG
jgi:hypothetical protein